jgi:type IV pilus assembly protein PilC
VFSVMLVIFTAMIVFIVPVFQNLFSTLGGKLPFPTRIVDQDLKARHQRLGAGDHRGDRRRHHRSPEVDRHRRGSPRKWDKLILRPPVFGPLFHKVALARMTGTLASLIGSGVPILESLDICADTAGNRTVGDVLAGAKKGCAKVGRWLIRCASTRTSFPPWSSR